MTPLSIAGKVYTTLSFYSRLRLYTKPSPGKGTGKNYLNRPTLAKELVQLAGRPFKFPFLTAKAGIAFAFLVVLVYYMTNSVSLGYYKLCKIIPDQLSIG
jgi:hypothetical protein